MVPVKPIVDVLCAVGKQSAPILKKVVPSLKAIFKNKKVQEVAISAAGSALSMTAQTMLERIQDKELSVKKKLKLLNKLKNRHEISEEEYKKHHDRILSSL